MITWKILGSSRQVAQSELLQPGVAVHALQLNQGDVHAVFLYYCRSIGVTKAGSGCAYSEAPSGICRQHVAIKNKEENYNNR